MKALDAFIRTGRTAYPEAKIATKTFEAELHSRLKAVVAARKKWGPFDMGRTTPGSNVYENNDTFVCLTVSGRIGKEAAALDVGFWWNVPGAPFDAIVYASFLREPERLLGFKYDGSNPSVKAFDYEGRTILAAPMPDDMDPTAALNAELDILVREM